MSTYEDSTTKLTYDDYALIPNDGMRHEIIDGRHYMNAAPNPRHQTVSRRIQFQLYEQIELKGLGQVFNAPIDLQLSEIDVVQPDIVVVQKENHIITTTRIRGVPDLVIEILSPSNRKYDQELKKRLYEQHGIPEYWIVDPEKCCLDQNLLGQNRKYSSRMHINEVKFEPLASTVDLKSVWAS